MLKIKNNELNKTDLQILNNKFKNYPQIERVLLYGSRDLASFQEGSDIDFAIQGTKVSDKICSKLHYHLEEKTFLPYFFDVTNYQTLKNNNLRKHIDNYVVLIYPSK